MKNFCVKYLPFLIIPLLVLSWGMSRYQSKNDIHVKHLQVKTNLNPMGQGVLPEQRRDFSLKLQKTAKADFKDAVFTTTGDFHTTFSIRSNGINGELASSVCGGEQFVADLRKMGFRHLVLSNGKEAWDIDLRN